MTSRRLARCLVYPALLAAAACQNLYHYRPVAVVVQDAETRQPITGADVRIWYPLASDTLAPYDSSDKTGSDGVARLRAAAYKDAGFMVETTAAGYIYAQTREPPDVLRPPAHGDRGDVRLVVEMLAEPAPAVELVLPPGYRGLVKARVHVRNDLPHTPGQRLFSFTVPESGAVDVTGPPLLGRVKPAGFRARYADGPPLAEPTDGTVGFRWLRHDDDAEVFLAGTQLEFNRLRRASEPESGEHRPHGGGGGRRHRGGDASAP